MSAAIGRHLFEEKFHNISYFNIKIQNDNEELQVGQLSSEICHWGLVSTEQIITKSRQMYLYLNHNITISYVNI